MGQDILQDLNYEYDAVGNIVEITDDAQQIHYFNNQVIAPVATFEYDALYRLTKATGRELTSLNAPDARGFVNDIPVPNMGHSMQNYVHNYEYDALGNMLSDAWKSYEYATENNYLLGHDNFTDQYEYDNHGNITLMSHLSLMSYDYDDRLFSAGNGTFTSYYNYDAEGNRTRKVVDKGNIVETRYYIGGYEVYRKVENGLGFERTTLNISDDEKVFVRIETEIGMLGSSEVIRYQYDNHLGSACLELDEGGYIISYEEYHPFGTTSYRAGRSETEVSLKRYKYNGKERDEETGLYYYGARYYAAWLCRFISVDRLAGNYPHVNGYCYCLNNPVNLIDPDGMAPWPVAQKNNGGSRVVTSGMYRNNSGAFHGGVDIAYTGGADKTQGAPITTTHSGVVTQSGTSTSAGNWVQVTNGDIRTTYMHMEEAPTLKVGAVVKESDAIGNVGNTGSSKGAHLHYQIEILNPDTGIWEKINPVVGEPDKVNSTMEVELIDPQSYINYRDGLIPGSSTEMAVPLQPVEVTATPSEKIILVPLKPEIPAPFQEQRNYQNNN